MKVEKSNIRFTNFVVVDLKITCNFPDKSAEQVLDSDVDLNYEIFQFTNDVNSFQIRMDLNIAPPEDKFGYKMQVSCMGNFNFDEGQEKEQIDVQLNSTCIPLLLGNLRGVLSTITSNFPFGKYLLPSLSIKSIIDAGKK
jgi:preprotein translocase subunit SecB